MPINTSYDEIFLTDVDGASRIENTSPHDPDMNQDLHHHCHLKHVPEERGIFLQRNHKIADNYREFELQKRMMRHSMKYARKFAANRKKE